VEDPGSSLKFGRFSDGTPRSIDRKEHDWNFDKGRAVI